MKIQTVVYSRGAGDTGTNLVRAAVLHSVPPELTRFLESNQKAHQHNSHVVDLETASQILMYCLQEGIGYTQCKGTIQIDDPNVSQGEKATATANLGTVIGTLWVESKSRLEAIPLTIFNKNPDRLRQFIIEAAKLGIILQYKNQELILDKASGQKLEDVMRSCAVTALNKCTREITVPLLSISINVQDSSLARRLIQKLDIHDAQAIGNENTKVYLEHFSALRLLCLFAGVNICEIIRPIDNVVFRAPTNQEKELGGYYKNIIAHITQLLRQQPGAVADYNNRQTGPQTTSQGHIHAARILGGLPADLIENALKAMNLSDIDQRAILMQLGRDSPTNTAAKPYRIDCS